ncbi:hypothetical protein I4U23_012173 [Adineta vaga]|nr:hypothetical protein I4U23_012173 [Adineta vaga]
MEDTIFRMTSVYFICCVIAIYCRSIVSAGKSVIVHTDYGDIQGYKTDLARIFYGISYAQPPVDTLSLPPIMCPEVLRI